MNETYQDLEASYHKEPEALYLNDWVFHYNPYTELWAAIPRDLYHSYWNNFEHPRILRAKFLNTLVDLLHKSKGSQEIIQDLTTNVR